MKQLETNPSLGLYIDKEFKEVGQELLESERWDDLLGGTWRDSEAIGKRCVVPTLHWD